MGRRLIPERKGYDETHPHEIVGHTGEEIEAVAGKIAHFAYVDDVDKSGVKGLHLHRQGDFQALATAQAARATMRGGSGGVPNLN